MPIAEDSAGGSPVPIPTNLTTNLTGEATGSGTLDYTTGDIDIAVTVVDNGHNHILSNITDVQVNNAISGQILVYNGTVWANATNTSGITALVQDTSPQLGGNLDLNNRNITGTGNIAITGTIDGRDVSADGTKLDGIESGATADQTAAQIKTAYESNANTNNFADADVSKLSGIEPGATADQTATQIKTAYESNSNTNAFTDADHTKLDGIETAADVTDTTNVVASLTAGTNVTIAADGTISATGGTSGIAHVVDDTTPELGGNLSLNSHDITGTGNLNFTGSVTLSGTVDGRDVAADGTKLDGIEAGANITDTANVTAAGALMDSEVTNLAQVKAFDSSDYATAAQGTTADAALPKAGGTMTGDLLFNDSVKAKFGDSNDLQIWHNGTDSYVYDTGAGDLILRGSSNIKLQSSGGTALSTFTAAGASTLYFSAAEKLATTSSGIDVTGNVVGDGLTIAGDATFTGGGTGSIVINDEDSSLCPTMTFLRNGGGTTTNDFIKFENSGGEVANIDSTGGALFRELKVKGSNTRRIDISNTTLADTGEMATLQWDNSANFTIQGRTSASVFAANWYSIQTSDTDGRADAHIFYTDASTERMRINSTGIDVTGAIDVATSGASNSSNAIAIATSGTNFESDGGIISIDHAATGAVTGGYFSKYSAGGTLRHSIKGDGTGYFAGRLGIGHTSPVAKMAILGSSNTTVTEANSNLCVEGSGGNGMLFGTLSTSGFKSYIQSGFVSNLGLATYDLLLNPEGGNVGIGTTSPAHELHIESTSPTIRLVDSDGSNTLDITQSGSASYLTFDNNMRFRNASNVEKLRIDSNGILVTDASDVSMDASANGQIKVQGSGYGFGIALDADAANLYTNSSSRDLVFGVNETEVARVKPAGLDVTGATNTTGAQGTRQWSAGSAGQKLGIYAYDNSTFYHRLETGNATNYQWGTYDNIPIYTITNNSIRTTLTGDGKFGVGLTAPTAKMHLFTNGIDQSVFSAQTDLGANNRILTLKSPISDSGTAPYRWQTSNSIQWEIDTAETKSMQLSSAGNLGIGTYACADKLHVEGNVYLGTSSRSVYCGGGGDLRLQTNTGEVKVLTANGATTNLITLGTGINIPNNLQVGSTLEVGSLTPAQDGAIEVGVIALGTPAIASTTDSTGLRNHIIFDNPNGVVGKINTINSATSYLTSSDYRLKTDVQEMTGSIDRVKALRPVNFEWVVDGTRVDGFLAHEAQEVVPEAVDGEKDAMRDQQYVESEATGDIYTPAVEATYETIQVELTPAVDATYDDEGNELTSAVDATYEAQERELTPAIDEVIYSSDVVEPDELEEGQLWRETTQKVMATRQVPDYQGIDQSKIVPLLTSALQDAIAKIEALETRLEALES